jgi:hypothetical protein
MCGSHKILAQLAQGNDKRGNQRTGQAGHIASVKNYPCPHESAKEMKFSRQLRQMRPHDILLKLSVSSVFSTPFPFKLSYE